jgi:hypothetical protein
MKAIIEYWYSDLSHITGYPKGHEVSEDKIMETVRSLYGDGVNVMLYHSSNGNMIIWVDDKRFGQR